MKFVNCNLEFGRKSLCLRLPAAAHRLAMPADAPLPRPDVAIRRTLADSIGAPPLLELARRATSNRSDPKAVIVVSDNTRPVPYRGADGILLPVIETLRAGGIARIEILVATGTHRPLSGRELRALLPDAVFDGKIAIVNHVCTENPALRYLGRTPRGTEVFVNTRYLDADLKILTGLVEPHFMAGASGGPKSVCPGIVGQQVTHVFHGPDLMNDERCASLNVDDNPCQAESLAVARMAGVDYIVNVTLNRNKKITGVYAGELCATHAAAVTRLLKTNAIRIAQPYDLVITHAGFSGINHYQAAKAAVEAAKAVRPGGTIVLAAHHTDVDPVGGENYRRLLPMLSEYGPAECTRRFFAPDWDFVPEQWEIQMWGRVFRRLGALDRLVYCAPRLSGDIFRRRGVPGRDGGAGLEACSDEREQAELMVQTAADRHVRAKADSSIAVLLDGPYGVPLISR